MKCLYKHSRKQSIRSHPVPAGADLYEPVRYIIPDIRRNDPGTLFADSFTLHKILKQAFIFLSV